MATSFAFGDQNRHTTQAVDIKLSKCISVIRSHIVTKNWFSVILMSWKTCKLFLFYYLFAKQPFLNFCLQNNNTWVNKRLPWDPWHRDSPVPTLSIPIPVLILFSPGTRYRFRFWDRQILELNSEYHDKVVCRLYTATVSIHLPPCDLFIFSLFVQ